MRPSVYRINKGVNRPIYFKGLQAQWIGYLGVGLVLLLLVFAMCYVSGVPLILLIPFVVICAIVLFWKIFELSKKHGQHGLLKKMAAGHIPKAVKCDVLMKEKPEHEKSI